MYEVIFAVPVTVLFALLPDWLTSNIASSPFAGLAVAAILAAKLMLFASMRFAFELEQTDKPEFFPQLAGHVSFFSMLSDIAVLQVIIYLASILLTGWVSPWLPLPLALATQVLGRPFTRGIRRFAMLPIAIPSYVTRLQAVADSTGVVGASLVALILACSCVA